MSETRTKEKQVLDLARAAGILRLTDLTEKGIHPEHLRRLHQKGLLVRIGRGVYTLRKQAFRLILNGGGDRNRTDE